MTGWQLVSRLPVWAPDALRVRAVVDGREQALVRTTDGWWRLDDAVPAGTAYAYRIDDDDSELPDPASRQQPDGVHGPSRVYDQSTFAWTDSQWTGRPLAGAVIYELHVGTFTPGATLLTAIEKLPHLVELGITHVELMPVNAFNGIWGWGYDGVDWYAVHEPYGGPDALKQFVDAAHAAGLAVLLDVVYNHLGPSGNYLPRFGPYVTADRGAWGEVINLDGADSAGVRRFIIENALMWLDDFHVDGLRLDAVHALVDGSTPHLLAALSRAVDARSAHLGRSLVLIAESDLNDPVMITPREAHGYGLDGQWDDDVHHALHALVTGERDGYYCDFGSLAVLAKVFTRAFEHDGTFSTFRGHMHGRPVDRSTTAGHRFVVALQNHDQVGNRAVGDRITELAPRDRRLLATMLIFCSPYTPMLWMGEEWGATTRWPYFTSHPEPELARAIAAGRAEEFADHGWDGADIPDPQDPHSYRTALLDWDEVADPEHAHVLDVYRRLIALRRRESALSDPRLDLVDVAFDDDLGWFRVTRADIVVVANFGAAAVVLPLGPGDLLFEIGTVEPGPDGLRLGPDSGAVVRVQSGGWTS